MLGSGDAVHVGNHRSDKRYNGTMTYNQFITFLHAQFYLKFKNEILKYLCHSKSSETKKA